MGVNRDRLSGVSIALERIFIAFLGFYINRNRFISLGFEPKNPHK